LNLRLSGLSRSLGKRLLVVILRSFGPKNLWDWFGSELGERLVTNVFKDLDLENSQFGENGRGRVLGFLLDGLLLSLVLGEVFRRPRLGDCALRSMLVSKLTLRRPRWV
jgi:hypothetical protein